MKTPDKPRAASGAPVGAAAAAATPATGVRFSRALLALILGQIGLHACMAGVRMAAPLQALRQGQSEWAVGVLLALFALAPIALALYAGRLADRLGYHRPLYIAVGLSLLGGVVATSSSHYLAACLAAVLTGAGANFGLIVIQRTAGQMAGDNTERIRIFSWLGLAPALSNVVGPLTAGVLIDLLGFRAAFGVLALMPLAAFGFSRFVPREVPAEVPREVPRDESHEALGAAPRKASSEALRAAPGDAARAAAHAPGGGARAEAAEGPALGNRGKVGALASAWDLLRMPALRRLLLVNWLVSASWDVHAFVLPILGHERGLSASAIGGILGAFALAVAGVRLIIPVLAHRLSQAQVLSGAMVCTAAVFGIYPFVHLAWTMGLCAVVLGMALGSVQPMIMSTLHNITPVDRHGEAIALRSIAINLSSSLMPLLFGAAGAVVGAGSLFWVMGAAVGAGSWRARRL